MILPFRVLMFVVAFVTGIVTSYSVFAEDVFDRLDGKGPSGKRVDVIEWESNLEVHVYPKGSLLGLSAKLDDREEGKGVMVIGYRLSATSKPLVRRAILGVPFTNQLKGFVDRTEKDFDKIAISNQNLPAPWTAYKFDKAPAQWYPDGHEKNNEETSTPQLTDRTVTTPGSRAPASVPTKVVTPKEETDSLNHFSW